MSERRFVVEVTRPVPAADVGGVSTRIAERLEMDPQRIHTLLHGRKGPVTKPVLPDKAAAIAEVFMEAGVEVAVVPAPDPVVSFLSGGEPDARPEAGVDSAVESGSGPYDAPAYEPDDEPDFGPEPDLELEAEHYAEAPWGEPGERYYEHGRFAASEREAGGRTDPPGVPPHAATDEAHGPPYDAPMATAEPQPPRTGWDTSSAWAVEDTGSWSALRPIAPDRVGYGADEEDEEDAGWADAEGADAERAEVDRGLAEQEDHDPGGADPGVGDRLGVAWAVVDEGEGDAPVEEEYPSDPEEEADRLGPRRRADDIAVFTTSTRWVPSPHDGYAADDHAAADGYGESGAVARGDRGWSEGASQSAGRGTGGTKVPGAAYGGASWIAPPARAGGPRLRPYLVWSLVASIAVFLLLQYVMAGRMTGALAPSSFETGMAAYRGGDFGGARRALEPEADAGNHLAQYYLGYMAQNGLGQPWSNAKAAAYYRRAAEGGVPEAQLALGDLYLRGMGVERDDVIGASWYARAAALGNPQGQYEYGKLLLHGTGVVRNPVAALAQFRAAAATGVTPAADYVAFAMEALREDAE